MTDDVLILIDQQKAMGHPRWGPRNNPQAEGNIFHLLSTWRARKWPIIHVKHDLDLARPRRSGRGRSATISCR